MNDDVEIEMICAADVVMKKPKQAAAEEYDEYGDPIRRKPQRAIVECRHCSSYPTWAEQRRAFAYMADAGLPPEHIKKMQPLCVSCAALFRDMIGLTRHPKRTKFAR